MALFRIFIIIMLSSSFANANMRGTMIDFADVTASDLSNLADWGAEIIRIPVTMTTGIDDSEHENYETPELTQAYIDAVWADSIVRLKTILGWATTYNLKAIVDMQQAPYKNNEIFWDTQLYMDIAVMGWENFATELSAYSGTVYGYDLFNEPINCTSTEWHDLAQDMYDAIRVIDSSVRIIVSFAPYGTPYYASSFTPITGSNVMYTFHMYAPHAFTHQGVGAMPEPVTYPGTITTYNYECYGSNQSLSWDKTQAETCLQSVVNFQNTHNVRILVGEFSAIRKAPGAYQYLKDIVSIFESHDWDWTYHSYREADGWNLEYPSFDYSINQDVGPTDREMLIRGYLKGQTPSAVSGGFNGE